MPCPTAFTPLHSSRHRPSGQRPRLGARVTGLSADIRSASKPDWKPCNRTRHRQPCNSKVMSAFLRRRPHAAKGCSHKRRAACLHRTECRSTGASTELEPSSSTMKTNAKKSGGSLASSEWVLPSLSQSRTGHPAAKQADGMKLIAMMRRLRRQVDSTLF